MLTLFILIAVSVLTLICAYLMFSQCARQKHPALSLKEKFKLGLTGFIAFISDTIGVGSFAVNIALSKFLGLFEDEELPAVCNGAQVIPGALQSIFFIQVIYVDPKTLLTLVLGACIGGLIGGYVVTRLNQQAIRLTMMTAFTGVICLLILKKIGLIPTGGELLVLESWKLTLGFFAMIVCGSLTSAGIGLFGLVQAVLFLLGVSPAIAFPIMTTAGAMQQPLTTLVFLKHNKIPLKKTLLLSTSGCLGVILVIPMISHFKTSWLHSLLLLIMLYNVLTISLTYRRKKNAVTEVLATRPS